MASEAEMNNAVAEGTEVAAEEVAPMMGGKRSKWLAHVKKTMRSHKGKSLKQVLKLAKKTYKGGSYLSPVPVGQETGSLLKGGRRTRRLTKKGRKGSRKH
jgi:hypothetical protein